MNKFFTFLLVLNLLSPKLIGQVYQSTSYFTQNGLPSNVISGITQGKDGRLWFLTSEGVASYDGIKWRTSSGEAVVPRSWPGNITSTEDGTIVMSGLGKNEFAVSWVKDNNYKHIIPNFNGLEPSVFHSLAANSSLKQIAIGFSNYVGVYHYEKGQWLHDDEVEDLGSINWLTYKDDTLWIATSKGLHTYLDGRINETKITNTPNPGIYNVLPSTKTNGYYLLGLNWLGIWTNGRLDVLSDEIDPSVNIKSSLTFDGSGNLLFNSKEKFYRFNIKTNQLETFEVDESDVIPWNASMLLDSEKNLWIGTYRGAFKISSFRFGNLKLSKGIQENEGTIIFELTPGEFFLGGARSFTIMKGGVFNSKRLSEYNQFNSRLLDYAVKPGSNKVFIAGGSAGLGLLSNRKVLSLSNVPSTTALGLINDELYFGNGKFIYKYIEGESPQLVFSGPGYIRDIVQFDSELIYLVSAAGLVETDFKTSKVLRYKSKIGSNLYCVADTEFGVLAGSSEGLVKVERDSLVDIEILGMEISDPVYDIFTRSNGDLWLGTGNGVYIINESEIRHYDVEDGLSGSEVNRNSLMEDSFGRVWIGTNGGVSIYDDQYEHKSIIQPKAELVKIVSKRKIHSPKDTLLLKPDENDLEFHYCGISFKNEKKIRYRYRLIGYDSSWIEVNNPYQRSARYTNLPSNREFQFEFQTALAGFPWTNSVFSKSIFIDSPFYAKWWFMILCMFAVIIAIYFSNYFLSQITHRKILEKQVAQKTEEIEESKMILEAQNAFLQTEIEEREKIELQRTELINKLKKTNRELDRFVYSVSHDISAPLKSIEGLIRIAELEGNGENEYLPLMKKSIYQLEQFVNELIDFSRNARVEIVHRSFDMEDLVKEIIDSLHHLDDRKGLEITTCIKNRQVTSDPIRIRMILSNLISNAINFADHIKTHSKINILSWVKGNSLFIEVSDNGVGISKDQQKKVFKMFHRANESSKGSGLGLYIVKETVDRLSGTIALYSKKSQGTTVLVEIPN